MSSCSAGSRLPGMTWAHSERSSGTCAGTPDTVWHMPHLGHSLGSQGWVQQMPGRACGKAGGREAPQKLFALPSPGLCSLLPRLLPRPNPAVISGWPQVVIPHGREEGEAENEPRQSAVCGRGAAERALAGLGAHRGHRALRWVLVGVSHGCRVGLSRGCLRLSVLPCPGHRCLGVIGAARRHGHLCRVLSLTCLLGQMKIPTCSALVSAQSLPSALQEELSSREGLIHPW